MYPGNDHPSDIDMFYLCKDDTLIIGEFKNELDRYGGEGQKRIIARLLNLHKGDAVGLFITHHAYRQLGDDVVDGTKCFVEQIYIKGENKWRYPKQPITVGEVLEFFRRRKR